jgi:hypothetical protein
VELLVLVFESGGLVLVDFVNILHHADEVVPGSMAHHAFQLLQVFWILNVLEDAQLLASVRIGGLFIGLHGQRNPRESSWCRFWIRNVLEVCRSYPQRLDLF